MTDPEMNKDEELQRLFLTAGKQFFEFNGSKNTPNILLQLNENLKQLNSTISEASVSSANLAKVLNRISSWGLCIAGVGVLVALLSLVFEIIKYCC